MSALLPVYPRLDLRLVGAEGTTLLTDDGRRLTDLYGGHAVCSLGHGHPAVLAAMGSAKNLDFYSNSLHLPGQEAAADAVLAGSALAAVFFVTSGTEANEAALHLARRFTGRSLVLSFANSFHGRTPGSLAATGLAAYRGRLTLDAHANAFIRFGEVADLERITDAVAAVLCEAVPSLAGVFMPPPGYYEALEARCREVGALLIFDEVQAGAGRLGTWFAHERFGVSPDIVTLAKSLGAGYPVGAVAVGGAIAAWVEPGELGTTFGGGPVAAAVVAAVRATVDGEGLLARAAAIGERVVAGLSGVAGVEVRGAGCLLGVQTPLAAGDLQAALLGRGMLVGTSAQANTIRLLPPYTLADAEVDAFVAAVREILP